MAVTMLAMSCGANPPSPMAAPSVAAPAFDGTTLAGEPISLASLRGSVVLLDFWATWCEPCREEIPHLIALHEQYRSSRFTVLGASVDYGRGVVERFVEQLKISYPVFLDDGEIARAYRVRSIPTTVLIDGQGRVRRRYTGYQPRVVLERDIQSVLSETVATP